MSTKFNNLYNLLNGNLCCVYRLTQKTGSKPPVLQVIVFSTLISNRFSGNVLVLTNLVVRRRTRLVFGWVTLFGRLYFNQPSG